MLNFKSLMLNIFLIYFHGLFVNLLVLLTICETTYNRLESRVFLSELRSARDLQLVVGLQLVLTPATRTIAYRTKRAFFIYYNTYRKSDGYLGVIHNYVYKMYKIQSILLFLVCHINPLNNPSLFIQKKI